MTWEALLTRFGWTTLILVGACVFGKYIIRWGWVKSWLIVLTIETFLALIRPGGMKLGTLDHWAVVGMYWAATILLVFVHGRKRSAETASRLGRRIT